MNHQEKILSYYQRCVKNYKKWWHLDSSRAIHAGYWDETTSTLSQALDRENQILAQKAKVGPGDTVLDIGCGVGGSAIFLVTQLGCRVLGVDISPDLIHQAKHYAHEAKVEVEFRVMDYEHLTLPSGSYDIVWMMESFCHARDKAKLIEEAYRLLKVGGRIVLADGFNAQESYGKIEKKAMRRMEEGLGLSEYITGEKLVTMMQDVGFCKVEFEDITTHVSPSSRRLFFYAIPLIIWSKIGEYIGFSTPQFTEDYKGYFYQYGPLKKRLVRYGIVCGEKPIKPPT